MESNSSKWVNRLALIWVMMLWVLPFTAHAQITNVTLTVTNSATNGADLLISGYPRTLSTSVSNISVQIPITTIWAVIFTNTCAAGQTITVNNSNVWTSVSSITNPTNQFLAGTNNSSSATNFFQAYGSNASPFTTVVFGPATSNQVNVYSYYGVPLSVTNSGDGTASGFASIVATNDAATQATNIFLAYGAYQLAPPSINLFWVNSNTIQFQSFNATAFSISIPTNGYGYLSLTNTYYVTNLMPILVPESNGPVTLMGNYVRSNSEQGIVNLLNDTLGSNSVLVQQTNWEWSEFLGTNAGANFTNYASNIVVVSSNVLWAFSGTLSTNSTNYASNLFAVATNYTGIYYTNSSNYTFTSSNFLWTLFDPLLTQGSSYVNSVGDISLSNVQSSAFTALRFVAYDPNNLSYGPIEWFNYNSGSSSYYEAFSTAQNPGTAFYDSVTGASYIGSRLEIDDGATSSSNTYIRGGAALTLGNNGPALGGQGQIGAGVAVGGGQGTFFAARPVVMQYVSTPCVAMGTLTNFPPIGIGPTSGGPPSFNTNQVTGDTFTNVGDTISESVGINFAASDTYDFGVAFNGNSLLDTGSFTAGGSSSLAIEAEFTKGSGTAFTYKITFIGYELTNVTAYCRVGSSTLNTANPTNVYLAVSAGGAATNHAVIRIDNVKLAPSAVWAQLP